MRCTPVSFFHFDPKVVGSRPSFYSPRGDPFPPAPLLLAPSPGKTSVFSLSRLSSSPLPSNPPGFPYSLFLFVNFIRILSVFRSTVTTTPVLASTKLHIQRSLPGPSPFFARNLCSRVQSVPYPPLAITPRYDLSLRPPGGLSLGAFNCVPSGRSFRPGDHPIRAAHLNSRTFIPSRISKELPAYPYYEGPPPPRSPVPGVGCSPSPLGNPFDLS